MKIFTKMSKRQDKSWKIKETKQQKIKRNKTNEKAKGENNKGKNAETVEERKLENKDKFDKTKQKSQKTQKESLTEKRRFSDSANKETPVKDFPQIRNNPDSSSQISTTIEKTGQKPEKPSKKSLETHQYDPLKSANSERTLQSSNLSDQKIGSKIEKQSRNQEKSLLLPKKPLSTQEKPPKASDLLQLPLKLEAKPTLKKPTNKQRNLPNLSYLNPDSDSQIRKV